MSIYLYLNEKWHADNWVNGGTVPLSFASNYLSEERNETLTPDENLIYDFPVPKESLSPLIFIGDDVQGKGLTMYGNSVDGIALPNIYNANRYNEDGLVICCSSTLSGELAVQLGNKQAVLEVTHPEKLRRAIDKQLGCKGIVKSCDYTDSHQRNHFLKSKEDDWQDEYRFFWKYSKKDASNDKSVVIPEGIAKLIQYF